MEEEEVEPAYWFGWRKKVDIASGETSKTITGLEPGTEYTVLLVNREKSTCKQLSRCLSICCDDEKK